MTRSSLKLVGILAAALSAMALFAGAAQAENLATWLVLKTQGGTLETLAEMEAESVEGSLENNIGRLLTHILGLNIEIRCTTGEIINAKLRANGTISGGGTGAKVKFSGCNSFEIGGAELPGCKPRSNGAAFGTVETRAGTALLELHQLATSTDDVVLILPVNAAMEFVELEMEGECAFGEFVPIFGTFTVIDCEGQGRTHQQTHLIKEFEALTSLYPISDTPEHLNTHIDGSANIKLNSSRFWSGDPH